MARELPAEAERLLTSEPLVGHLATCHEDRPHVAPVWYAVTDGTIEIATTGRKLENIRHNPLVALSVQKAEGTDPEWAVTVRGTATVVEDAEAGREINRRINRRYDKPEDAWTGNTAVRIDVGSANHWRY